MAGFDRLDEEMLLGNFRAWNGHKYLGFDSVVRMCLPQIENKLFDGPPHFLQRHGWRNAYIEKNVRAIRRAADAPRKAGANAADVHDARLPVVGSFLLPSGNPC